MRNDSLWSGTGSMVIKLIATAVVLASSLWVMPFYTHGDQFFYRKVYEELPRLSLARGRQFYSDWLGSRELVHFYLTWLASRLVEKDIFIAFCNAALAWVAMSLFEKWRASALMAFWLVTTNYYFLVLYLAAERLKFAFVFLGLSILYFGSIKRFWFFLILALGAHTQVVIVYAALFCKVGYAHLSAWFRKRQITRLVFSAAPFLVIVPTLGGHMVSKFQSYYALHHFGDLARTLIFMALAMFYSREKVEIVRFSLPVLVAVFLVGGDRLNLISYFLFLFYGLAYKRGWNVGVIATSIYYTYASIGFLQRIFQHGNGWS